MVPELARGLFAQWLPRLHEVKDVFMVYDLTKEEPKKVKVYAVDRGILVLWNDSDVLLKAETKDAAQELLNVIPESRGYTFLVQKEYSELVKKRFTRREEVFSMNSVDEKTFKPVKDKQYEVVPIPIDCAEEIAKIWPYAKGSVDFVKGFFEKWPAYAILIDGSPVCWGTVLLETDKAAVTGMWYTREEYRNRGMARHVVSKLAEDVTGRGKILRADIRAGNTPSLKIARSLGFQTIGEYSRLEPLD